MMKKILIIEDTAQLRESIADALEMEGFQVIQAGDGYSGLKKVFEHVPDLILCDIMMPGIDGFNVLQSLKMENKPLRFPFIFITAVDERKYFREGMELGADDYLVKPFTISELLKAINARLNKHQLIEKEIKLQIEKIETELHLNISDLQAQIGIQQTEIEKVSLTNKQIEKQLNDNQAQLMQEALRSIEINTTLQSMAKQLSDELQKTGIPEEQRLILVNLRNKIRNRSVLLNNWTVFQLKFDQTYKGYSSKLILRFPHLTKQDLLIISATFINLNTHQLSVILCISPESVRKTKYRLKKKLNLDKHIDFYEFVHQLIFQDQ